MKPIYEQVKELEDSHKNADRIVSECRATMIVNYGPDGKAIKGLVFESDGLLQMIVSVFRHYHNRDELFEEMVEVLKNLRDRLHIDDCRKQGCILPCKKTTALLAKIETAEKEGA